VTPPAGPDYPSPPTLPLADLERLSTLLRVWGTAADTVTLEPSEQAARQAAADGMEVVVHRWPTGPFLRDDGSVWEGDPQLSRLHGDLWHAQTDLRAALARLATMRAALAGGVSVAEVLRADDAAARPMSEVAGELLGLACRLACSPESPGTHYGRSDCTDHGCGEA
jgi:hypothetical protein